MAYSSGSATDQEDLLTQLFSFATSAGWTVDESPTGGSPAKAALHRGSCYVQFAYNGTEGGGPEHIGLYQSLGFSGGTDPGSQADNSGFNPPYGNLSTRRRVADIGDGPYIQHLFFAPNSGGADNESYIHVALQYATGLWRHFGFGHLDKVGSWTGGEYLYGHSWGGISEAGVSSSISLGFDGLIGSTSTTTNAQAATVHAEGLPGMDPAEKWGACGNWTTSGVAAFPTDGNGEQATSMRGGWRGGTHLGSFGFAIGNPNNAAVPLIPIPVWLRDLSVSTERMRLLGYQRDVRLLNMKQFDQGEEITVGGDTWVIVPWVRKTNTGQEESENAGVAYLKIT